MVCGGWVFMAGLPRAAFLRTFDAGGILFVPPPRHFRPKIARFLPKAGTCPVRAESPAVSARRRAGVCYAAPCRLPLDLFPGCTGAPADATAAGVGAGDAR